MAGSDGVVSALQALAAWRKLRRQDHGRQEAGKRLLRRCCGGSGCFGTTARREKQLST